MANEVIINLVGNLGGEPEMRFTQGGDAVCNFSVAVTPRRLNKTSNEWEDGDPSWYRCTAWREFAENIVETLNTGDRVILSGHLEIREYETKDGVKGRAPEINITAIGPDLRFAQAKIEKVVSKEEPKKAPPKRNTRSSR